MLDLLNQSTYLQSKCFQLLSFQTFGFQTFSKPLASKCFPNLWLPSAFQNTSKCFSKRTERQSSGEFASKRFALQRHQIPRTISWQYSEREKSYLFDSLALRKVIPKKYLQTILLVFRLFLRADGLDYCDGLLRDKRIDVERTCGAIGRSRLAWGQSLTLLFRDSFRGFSLKRYK